MGGEPTVTERRLTAQLLAGPPAPDPVAVAERLLAVQAQDPRGFRLAVRARTSGLTAADVEQALTSDRSLVVDWLNRGTLHLVRREDHPWLHALTAPTQLTGTMRRLAQEGVTPADAERGVQAIERSLAAEGPLTRDALGDRVAQAGVRTEGQALIHVIALACLRGRAVRGPIVEGRHAYVLVRDWLGEPEPVDRDAALAELARRYLAGHGPATDRDLAKWAGLPLRDARAGLSAIAGELEEVATGGGAPGRRRPAARAGERAGRPAERAGRTASRAGRAPADRLLDLAGRPPEAELPPPRLLGAFDPVLLGWTSREPLLREHQRAVTVNGIFRPFALVGGRAVATWTMPRGEVVLAPFGRLRADDAEALEADAADVVRFLAGET